MITVRTPQINGVDRTLGLNATVSVRGGVGTASEQTFTMEHGFYAGRMASHGIAARTPDALGRALVHRVIYEELCRGQTLEESRREYRKVLYRLAASGAESIILGCTEISLLVGPEDSPVPLFDTTEIHARRAAEWALEPRSGKLGTTQEV